MNGSGRQGFFGRLFGVGGPSRKGNPFHLYFRNFSPEQQALWLDLLTELREHRTFDTAAAERYRPLFREWGQEPAEIVALLRQHHSAAQWDALGLLFDQAIAELRSLLAHTEVVPAAPPGGRGTEVRATEPGGTQ